MVKHRIVVQFYVERNCEITNIKVLKMPNRKKMGMDKEAVRVVRMLECIKPAYLRGKPIQYKGTIHFVFCKDKTCDEQ